jgi:hypothetical protein
VQLGEIGGGAALADHHQVGLRLPLRQRFQQVAVPQKALHLRHADLAQGGLGLLQVEPRLTLDQPRALRVELGQLLSVGHKIVERARFIVHRELVDQRLGSRIEPDHLDLGALAAEAQHRHVERGDRDVPDMGVGQVDHDAVSSASRKSKAAVKSSAEAKKTCPSTV